MSHLETWDPKPDAAAEIRGQLTRNRERNQPQVNVRMVPWLYGFIWGSWLDNQKLVARWRSRADPAVFGSNCS